MKAASKSRLLLVVGLCLALSVKAQTVYENLSTAPTAGFGDFNANNPIFGDSLNLTQGGTPERPRTHSLQS